MKPSLDLTGWRLLRQLGNGGWGWYFFGMSGSLRLMIARSGVGQLWWFFIKGLWEFFWGEGTSLTIVYDPLIDGTTKFLCRW